MKSLKKIIANPKQIKMQRIRTFVQSNSKVERDMLTSMAKQFISLLAAVIVISILIGTPHPLLCVEDDDCFVCHSDPTLTMEVNGKEKSLYVKDNILRKNRLQKPG